MATENESPQIDWQAKIKAKLEAQRKTKPYSWTRIAEEMFLLPTGAEVEQVAEAALKLHRIDPGLRLRDATHEARLRDCINEIRYRDGQHEEAMEQVKFNLFRASLMLSEAEFRHTTADVVALAQVAAYEFRTRTLVDAIRIAASDISDELDGITRALHDMPEKN